MRRIGLTGKNRGAKVRCLDRNPESSFAVLLLTSYIICLGFNFFILKIRVMLAVIVLEGCWEE